MKESIFLLIWGFVVHIYGELNLCSNGNATSGPVKEFCLSQNGNLVNRCCYAMNSKNLIAIDLIEMNLTEVPNLSEYENLTVIDLRLNSQLKSSKIDDFLGLKSLDDLLLPEEYSCPGGSQIWQIMNTTINPQGNLCQHPKNLCLNLNDLCNSTRSSCHPNGPNHFLCLCKETYYGYKCLRQGRFPVGKFTGLVIGITTIFSVFFYFIHRKNVKKD